MCIAALSAQCPPSFAPSFVRGPLFFRMLARLCLLRTFDALDSPPSRTLAGACLRPDHSHRERAGIERACLFKLGVLHGGTSPPVHRVLSPRISSPRGFGCGSDPTLFSNMPHFLRLSLSFSVKTKSGPRAIHRIALRSVAGPSPLRGERERLSFSNSL